MKTITELIAEANELKKRAADLQTALQEIEEAQNAPKNLVDMGKLMKRVAASKITGHILTEKNDPIVSEAYLTLLISLANTNAPTKGLNSSLEYPCRIAAALSSPPDMDLLLKKSLILDEPSITNYTNILCEHAVNESFALDGFLMITSYDKGNTGKIDYLANVVALLGISQDMVDELLTTLNAVLERKFAYLHFSQENFQQVLPCIKANCPGFIIDSPQQFIVQGDNKRNIPSGYMAHIQKIESRDKVSFNHVTLKGNPVTLTGANLTINMPISFSDINELFITDCTFQDFDSRVFTSENVANITISSSTFKNCVRDESDYRSGQSKGYKTYIEQKKSSGSIEGVLLSGIASMGVHGFGSEFDGSVLGTINGTKTLTITDTVFSNCAVKFSDRIELRTFALFEETFNTKVNIKTCKVENSCPIHF